MASATTDAVATPAIVAVIYIDTVSPAVRLGRVTLHL
jgi:hypothetical protein